jgi:hypothetical protein
VLPHSLGLSEEIGGNRRALSSIGTIAAAELPDRDPGGQLVFADLVAQVLEVVQPKIGMPLLKLGPANGVALGRSPMQTCPK